LALTVAAGAVLGAALLAPAGAAALDSDLKGAAVFMLKASNGYSILGFASSERIDGRGDIGLIVYREDAAAIYGAPAVITPSRLGANLGALGRISFDIVPSGKSRTLRSRCGGDPQTFEPDSYRGSFEFHGEQGYTEASATELSEYPRFLIDLGCGGPSHASPGPDRSGAWLRAYLGRGHNRLGLEVKKERAGAGALFAAEVLEKHDRISIERHVSQRAGSAAFDYDPLLRTAVVEPPSPFSGRCVFRRLAAPANRWTGDLAVDFPGRSDVPLADSDMRVSLVPASRAAGF
jgi:hypothetical protein